MQTEIKIQDGGSKTGNQPVYNIIVQFQRQYQYFLGR